MSTVEKALKVLELFSESRPVIGLSEAARLLSRDKSTVQRYLTDLAAAGYLEQDAATRGYYLGPALTRLSMVRERTHPVDRELRRILQDLTRATGETSHASQRIDGALRQIGIAESQVNGTRVYIDPAEPLPFHATASGLAYLSALCPEARAAITAGPLKSMTPETPTSAEALAPLIAQAEARGYALVASAFERDVVGQAAPILGYGEAPIGAVAVATPASRFDERVEARNAPAIITAAARLSAIFGAKHP